MKKIVFLFIIALVFGCVQQQIANPICPQEGSWICEQSAELGIEPETVYGWVYSAAAIAAISDVVKIKEICEFEQELADFYSGAWPISYASLVDEALWRIEFMDSEKAILIKNIINVNLVQYRSVELISEADDIILRKGHVAFRRDMACFD
jgi:hypothetical protein